MAGDDEGATVDLAARIGAAAAMRMQAASLRSMGELLTAQARAVEALADEIEDGAELPARPVKLAVVPLLDDDEPPASEAPATVRKIEWGAPVPGDMMEWLDLFDDRLRGSPHFATAVNEAADLGLLRSEETAAMVGARVSELTDAARKAAGDGD